jgi:hypothetical protein
MLLLAVRAALEVPRTLADNDVDAVRTPDDGGGAGGGTIILPAALADLECNGGGAMLDLPNSPPARSMPVLRFAAGSGTAKKKRRKTNKKNNIQQKVFQVSFCFMLPNWRSPGQKGDI